jgi:hypothetical protein
VPCFAGRTLGDFSRRPVYAALKACIAKATLSAVDYFEPLFGVGQIAEQFTRVNIMDNRTARNMDIEIVTGATGLVSAFATVPALCAIPSRNSKVDQRIDGRIRDKIDAAAIPPVTTIRPASLDIFFTTETKATMTTVACLNPNCRLVYEFNINSVAAKKKNPALSGVSKMNL